MFSINQSFEEVSVMQFELNWVYLALAVVSFYVDLLLTRPGSLRGWRGLARAIAEICGVAFTCAAFGTSLNTTLNLIAAIGAVRVICAIWPPKHEA